MKNKDKKNEKVDSLLNQLESRRSILLSKLADLEKNAQDMLSLFPQTKDFRNKFAVQERVKVTTEFYDVALRYEQEINRLIKEEIEFRRKLDQDDNTNQTVDVRDLIDQLENAGFTLTPSKSIEKQKEQESINEDDTIEHNS